jgi:hypothetical protein
MTQGNQMLNEIKAKHREVSRLSFEGLKPAVISTQTGISLATVYKILSDPLCKAYIGGLADRVDDRTLNVRERLMNLNTHALDRIGEILAKDSPAPYSVQASVSKDVLDRTGNKAPDKIDINHTLQGKSDDEIDAQIAAIESQLKASYSADLNPVADDDDDDDDSSHIPKIVINPKTDCKE